ncbi:MarR family transcriptional regulator [Yersinia ruckeri]|uniref:MarR family transcriptional regulator n=1 Tax=Yersinia ruckeri TaxID=29486 RepID=UPI0022372DD0|nr:MarR family transcriptional regulator [Yersinia ruckeri]MCW6583399.1 MarR family transcriptional regulator [Yersinia ruckeri]
MEGTKPLLLPNTVVSTDTASRAGVLLTIADIEQWDSFRRLLDYCDGKHTAQQIAKELLLDITTINKALTSLESAGFIWCLTDYQSIPTPLFLTEFNRWLPIWVDRMYDQPVWQGLYDGVEPASLLIGWAQENMHHTRSVMSHMPRAIEYANDKTGQNTQFRHLREEWDHYRLFMSACHSTGIDMSKLDNSPPLASTTNITYFMNSVAKMGTLVYNACEALLEATTQNGHSVADFYQTAGRQLALPRYLLISSFTIYGWIKSLNISISSNICWKIIRRYRHKRSLKYSPVVIASLIGLRCGMTIFISTITHH